ncbi:MAG TPA: methyltransferase domain-containing protein [Alphaproteobacteria bacterium]|jgi:malonyl-ACP O-methyltransferase BioC|nr:methyltransferase domain-containing protein [Alphaproteobacteria bacterium]
MNTENPAAPFDRGVVRRHRDRAATGFDGHAFLFDEIGERLLDRLSDIRRPFPRALELGSRDGRLRDRVTVAGELYVRTDLSERMARAAQTRNPGPLTVVADEELLPFAEGSFDLVVSNLSLHWVNDLPGALAQIRRVLRPDGLLLASLFGGETLIELRQALLAADVAVSDGASPRVSPFCDVRDAAHLLGRAGFALPVADVDLLTVTYSDILALMRDLRGMGETSALKLRQKSVTPRATFAAADEHYRRAFPADGHRLHATFEVIYLAAWRPHESQQKPLRPGAAATRLADALGAPEHPTGDPTRPRR